LSGLLFAQRILVVGASSGVGQAFAVQAVAEGASVVLAARREDRLAATVKKAGGGTAVVADVRSDGGAEKIVAAAVEILGGIDLIYYAVGYAQLQMLADVTADDWRTVLETNVIGLHETIRAAVLVMSPAGIIAVLSSEIVDHPRPGLATYSASKAAVEDLLRVWQLECPEVRFSCLSIGATYPTEFGDHFDPALLGSIMERWNALGRTQEELMETSEVAAFSVATYGTALRYSGLGVEYLSLRSPSPVQGSRKPD